VVEGAHLGTGRKNEAKHRVHVLEHVARSYAQHAKTLASEQRVARSVAARLVAERMTVHRLR
jgi:hypothetical protein